MRLVKMVIGTRMAIGISGTPAEIEGEVNAAYNWNYFGRTKPSLMNTREYSQAALAAEMREGENDRVHTLGHDGFAYFYTTPERLARGLKKRIYYKRLDREEGTKSRKAIWQEAQSEFEQTMANIENEYFMKCHALEDRRGPRTKKGQE